MFLFTNQHNGITRTKQLLSTLLLIGLLPLAAIQPVQAQDPNTFTVNRTEDVVDGAPGNGVCDADPQDKVLQCTLRAAIMEANALPGPQTIQVPSGLYRLTIFGRKENDSRTGDLDITSDLTIVGRGETQPIIDAAAIDRVFHVVKNDNTQIHLENLILRNGDAQSANDNAGGALLLESKSQATVVDSVISDNVAGSGGGIQLGRGAELTLITVRVQNNFATDLGGGIATSARTTIRTSTFSGNRAGQPGGLGAGVGGGLFVGSDNNKPVLIEQSTIAGNVAQVAGGGIGMVFVGSNLSVSNSTISGNSALLGAGIKIEDPVVLQHVTIANNSGSGILVADPNITVSLRNSIIANNSGQNCTFAAPGMHLGGDRNLSSDNSCPFVAPAANLSNTNPQLGPLQFNQGATQTHALLPGSPAINGGNNAVCTAVDQRGVVRPQGPSCDIGAFEVVP